MILEDEDVEQEQDAVQEADLDAVQDQDTGQDPALVLKSYKTQKNLSGIGIDSPEGSDAESLISDKSEDLDFNSDSDQNDLDNEENTLTQNSQLMNTSISPPDSEVESDEEDLQKIEEDQVLNYISRYHSECLVSNSDEIEALSKTSRINGIIVDANHKTNPILSRSEERV
jgi:hypothetical protein